MYTAYVLKDKSIEKLKELFNQDYPDFIGHHITVNFGVQANAEIPPETDDIYVIGVASQDGVQALLVSIDGNVERPNGGLYHVTWSIDKSKGKKPVDSNKIIHRAKTVAPIKIKATPELLR